MNKYMETFWAVKSTLGGYAGMVTFAGYSPAIFDKKRDAVKAAGKINPKGIVVRVRVREVQP